jgi:16S rRNA (adenine1518-N6/adenine1519-N6)-dimethyltransferase
MDEIARAGEVGPVHTVVEIGAGRGELTAVLARRARRVVALELDRDLIPLLKERFAASSNVQVVAADALRWPLPEALVEHPRPRVLVGNLPYNVGTQILLRFAQFPGELDRMVLMFQREVAERLVAEPATPQYGGITLLLRVDWDAKLGLRVPPGAFHPAPRVESAVVVLRPLARPRAEVGDRDLFARVVRSAFGRRRKTLKNALGGLGPGLGDRSSEILDRAGIDGSRRGETLSLEEFAGLSLAAQDLLREEGA